MIFGLQCTALPGRLSCFWDDPAWPQYLVINVYGFCLMNVICLYVFSCLVFKMALHCPTSVKDTSSKYNHSLPWWIHDQQFIVTVECKKIPRLCSWNQPTYLPIVNWYKHKENMDNVTTKTSYQQGLNKRVPVSMFILSIRIKEVVTISNSDSTNNYNYSICKKL